MYSMGLALCQDVWDTISVVLKPLRDCATIDQRHIALVHLFGIGETSIGAVNLLDCLEVAYFLKSIQVYLCILNLI